MSVLRNPVQRQSFAVSAGLKRLLLLCRFDYRQKSWELPDWEGRHDRDSFLRTDSAALASAISKNPSEFSDPSLGGAKPPMTATCRIGFRPPNHRSLGKTKQPKKEQ